MDGVTHHNVTTYFNEHRAQIKRDILMQPQKTYAKGFTCQTEIQKSDMVKLKAHNIVNYVDKNGFKLNLSLLLLYGLSRLCLDKLKISCSPVFMFTG